METEDTSLAPIDGTIVEKLDDAAPELPVVCTEHTSSNLHGYLFLLVLIERSFYPLHILRCFS